ncbi:MAG: LysR substrate-binding domain-containing protein [Acidimicrobiales bacterium]
MTPSQLHTFLAVARTGSVRRAAEQLVVSQPAVSSAMASLVAELGVELVAREGRGIRVTPAGRVLESYAAEVLGLMQEAQVATRAAADPESGRLRVAAVTTAGEHVLPIALRSFRAVHPRVEVVLEVGNRARLWELLRSREVDLAIGGRPPMGAGLETIATRPNELLVVAASRVGTARPAHPTTPGNPPGGPAPPGDHWQPRCREWRSREVGLVELSSTTWLVREAGSGTRATADALFDSLGISPATLTLGSNGAIAQSAEVGLGVALISLDAVRRQLADGVLEELVSGPLPLVRQWHLVSRAGGGIPETARMFIDHVLLGPGDWAPATGPGKVRPASPARSGERGVPPQVDLA